MLKALATEDVGRVQHGPRTFKKEISHACDSTLPILDQVLLFHLSMDFIDKVYELSERHPSWTKQCGISCCPESNLDPVIKIIWDFFFFFPFQATACILSWKK